MLVCLLIPYLNVNLIRASMPEQGVLRPRKRFPLFSSGAPKFQGLRGGGASYGDHFSLVLKVEKLIMAAEEGRGEQE